MLCRLSRWTLPTLIIFAALLACRVVVIRPEGPAIVLPRVQPLVIAPRFADERVVTDEQLVAVLARVKPPANSVSTNNFVHALRLWGARADFGDPQVPTGRELREYFLNDAGFRGFAGDDAPPLFYKGRHGIEVRGYDDATTNRATSSFHTDDLIATLAEIGTPLDTPLVLRDGNASVKDLLAAALARFQLEQFEYEWTAIAYARYVFPQREWRNKFGERITVDALVNEIVSHPPQLGPCNGLHRLEALAVLQRANEQHQTLSVNTKFKLLLYMKRATSALALSQSAEGYWTREWPSGAQALNASTENAPSLHDKLLVTGHHLEWLALAPEEVQPPRETIIRAAQWLARTLVEMDEKDLLAAYGPYTHAARSLCLWRGVDPYEFWMAHHQRQRLAMTNAESQMSKEIRMPKYE